MVRVLRRRVGRSESCHAKMTGGVRDVEHNGGVLLVSYFMLHESKESRSSSSSKWISPGPQGRVLSPRRNAWRGESDCGVGFEEEVLSGEKYQSDCEEK